MVDNIQIPRDLTQVVSINVTDTSLPLRNFLIKLVAELNDVKKRLEKLENV